MALNSSTTTTTFLLRILLPISTILSFTLASPEPLAQPQPDSTLFNSLLVRGIPGSACNSGPVLCCLSVAPATDPEVSALLNLMNLVAQENISGGEGEDGTNEVPMVGVTCAPMPIVGLGNHTCPMQTVCCERNLYKGLVAIGCQNSTMSQ